MAKIRSIRSDPRWIALVCQFRHNWILAPTILFGVFPTLQQMQLLQAAEKKRCRVSISSGHGTGKSSMSAIVVLIYMLVFPDARVVLIANKMDQVRIGVFKNLRVYFKALCERFPWVEDYFVLTDTMFYEKASKGVWELSCKSYKQGQEESLAGEHAEHYFVIIDEASALSDKAFGIITGAFTQGDNRMMLLSQPTRDNGYFWKTHNDPKFKKIWTCFVFNSEESVLVTNEFIIEKYLEYGADRKNPEYQIKVLGEFSKNKAGFILSADDCLKSTMAMPRLERDWGWVFACDVGNTRDSSVINISRVSGYRNTRRVVRYKVIEFEGSIDPVNFGREIINEYRSGEYKNAAILIDSDGVGVSTAVVVEEEGIPVQRVHWGLPCFSDEDKLRFINLRAMATVETAHAIKSGRYKLDSHNKTREQASRIPYRLDAKGRYCIEKKEVMREKLGIPSPDRFDTYCFMMLAEVVPATIYIDETTLQDRKEAGYWVSEVTTS